MGERSKRIVLFDKEKIKEVNVETLKLYKSYKRDMQVRSLSPKTIYSYETDLYAWFIYIYEEQGNMSIKDITEDDVHEFIYFCMSKGNNLNRIKRRFSSISAFYQFLRKKREVKENPVDFLDRPKSKNHIKIVTQTYLKEYQVQEMKDKLIAYGDKQLLAYALVSLDTMARVTAISSIKWSQVNFQDNEIIDVLEKEQREVTLLFNEETKVALQALKEERVIQGIDCKYVFMSKYQGRYDKVTSNTMNNWTSKIGEMIEVKELHPHDFRHSSATILRNNGMPLEDISLLLNHKSVDVTKNFYIKESVDRLKSQKDKYSGQE